MCAYWFYESFYFPILFSLILASFHRGWWSLPFSIYIWSAIPDFIVFPWIMAFWCSLSFTFRRQLVSLLYYLPQLHRMLYMQFLVMLSSDGDLNLIGCLQSMNCGNFITIVIHSCTYVNGSLKYYAYKVIITLSC